MPAGSVPAERDLNAFEQLVDEVARAVCAVDGVHGLHGGAMPQVATLLPRRRVEGLRITETGCEVHISVDFAADLRQTTAGVRAAVQTLVGDVAVDVFIEDLADPPAAAAIIVTRTSQERS